MVRQRALHVPVHARLRVAPHVLRQGHAPRLLAVLLLLLLNLRPLPSAVLLGRGGRGRKVGLGGDGELGACEVQLQQRQHQVLGWRLVG